MLLAIDIGNTNIVFGVYHADEWVKIWRIQTDALKQPTSMKLFSEVYSPATRSVKIILKRQLSAVLFRS